MMYVEFMKNFLLADSRELMIVRLILASWAQKQVIPTRHDVRRFRKIFFSPIRGSWRLLDSFCILSPETTDSYFVDMMYVEFMKNFLLADSSELLNSFWHPEKKVIPTL